MIDQSDLDRFLSLLHAPRVGPVSLAPSALAASGPGNDTLIGTPLADQLSGEGGNDSIVGRAGDDTLRGDFGLDTIRGDAGNDHVRGEGGNDRLVGGLGDDTLLGGDGSDVVIGGDGADSVTGGNGNDFVSGGLGADVVLGGQGLDTLRGGAGDDTLIGGAGADTLIGDAGDDVLDGGAQNDVIRGGDGDDTIVGSTGLDTISGGAGTDTLTLTGLLGDYRFEVQANGSVRIIALDGTAVMTVRDVELVQDSTGATAAPVAITTLQLLHGSDFEGNTDAIAPGTNQTVAKAVNFASLIDFFDDTYATTLFLSSGDNFIPSPFSAAQASTTAAAVQDAIEAALNNVMSELTGLDYENLQTERFRADVAILNAMGLDASVIGNHDFDLNQQGLLDAFAEFAAGAAGTADDEWLGALFPYLSANLEFEPESILNPFRDVDGIQPGEDATGLIAPYQVLETNGERFGYIGVTTQILSQISSTFGDPDNPNDDVTTGTANDMAALAAVIQPIVDQLEAQGVNKIILGSHLQQIRFEQDLAGLLTGVDIMIGGGSDAIFADGNDVLRPGNVASEDYPQVLENAAGNDVLLVNTDGQYNYVGRLVVGFDAGGNLVTSSLDDTVSGAYATDDSTVVRVTGAASAAEAAAASQRASWVKQITDAIFTAIQETSGRNFFADQAVDLNGGRNPGVRTQETNLGNLTADANLWYANELASEPVLVSLKNGGGIRASIVNDDGLISELDIATALAFNNELSLVTLTTDQLLEVLNYAVAASTFDQDGNAPLGTEQGRFPQIAGVRFSFEPDDAAGDRVSDVWVTDADGTEVKIFDDGAATAGAAQFAAGIRVVTLSFLLTGGDGYPFPAIIAADPAFADVVSLYDDTLIVDGAAQFENVGTEQDAFAEYLAEFFPVDADPANDFAIADTPAAEDLRIQNLNVPGVVDFDV